MSVLQELQWETVLKHYKEREEIHRQLLNLYRNENLDRFVRLLLGIDDPAGNYSADEHKLGYQILNGNPNAVKQIVALAKRFMDLKKARTVPELIRTAAIRYLKIGVGSEASCMVNPQVCWVANTRTIWAHLVITHDDNFGKADEELKYYRTQDGTSEMGYKFWAEIHRLLETSLTRIAEAGERLARQASVPPGPIKFLWADAIAAELYARHHD
jgi:hypothetical protein